MKEQELRNFGMYKVIRKVVKKLLETFPVLRDDYIKTYKITSVIIFDEINLRKLNFESVRRTWQKIQEEIPELRGKLREKRIEKAQKIREEIRKWKENAKSAEN